MLHFGLYQAQCVKVLLGPIGYPKCQQNIALIRAYYLISRALNLFVIFSIFCSYDEKRYSSACIEPPVPKCYLGQLDAQNDVLVLEDLGQSGYRKYSGTGSSSSTGNCNSRYLSGSVHVLFIQTLLRIYPDFILILSG